MARNSSGNYTLPAGNPVVTGTSIDTSWANGTMTDIANALTDSLDRTGKGGMLAPLPFVDGSVSAPSVSFTTEPGSGLYRAGAADIRIAVIGTDSVTFKPGKLGVGIIPANTFDVASAGATTVTVQGGAASTVLLGLGDAADPDAGAIAYDNTTNRMGIRVGGLADAITIDGLNVSFAGSVSFPGDVIGDTLVLESDDDGSTPLPLLELYRNSATPAIDDDLGQILFTGKDDTDTKVSYARIFSEIADPASSPFIKGRLHLQGAASTLFAGVTINEFGYLGVNEPNPLDELHISAGSFPGIRLTANSSGVDEKSWSIGYDTNINKLSIKSLDDSFGAQTAYQIERSGSAVIGQSWFVNGSVAPRMSIGPTGNLAVDTNTLFVDAVNNRVGIGTSAPEASLQLGASSSEIHLALASNVGLNLGAAYTTIPAAQNHGYVATATAGAGGANGDLLVAPRTSAACNIRFITGTTPTERMRIDSSGNVGIGGPPLATGQSATNKTLYIANTDTAALSLDSTATGRRYTLLSWTDGSLNVRDEDDFSFRFSILANGNITTGGLSGARWCAGNGSPEGVVTARRGSFYSRFDGGAGTCFYVKESGDGNTGWVAK